MRYVTKHRYVTHRRRPRSRRSEFIGPLPEHVTGEYALENPLSGGELAFVFLVGGLGYAAADFIGRYFQTTAVASPTTTVGTNSVPTGALVANDVATLSMPNWKSMAAQGGLAVVAGGGAYYAKSPMARASLQGAMIGAGLHLFGDIFKSLMARFLENGATGQRLYLAEIEARNAGALAAAGTSNTAGGPGTLSTGITAVQGSTVSGGSNAALAGLPRGVGHVDVGPRAVHGVGQFGVSPPAAPPPPPTQGRFQPPPPPVTSYGQQNAPPPPLFVQAPGTVPLGMQTQSTVNPSFGGTVPAPFTPPTQAGYGGGNPANCSPCQTPPYGMNTDLGDQYNPAPGCAPCTSFSQMNFGLGILPSDMRKNDN